MFVRNFDGHITQIDKDAFLNDKEFYRYLWKIKFNIDLSKQTKSFNQSLMKYINGINFFI
jgi:2-hydroxy-3-keto-5-methylthiopentenyl-1-phosphate phosphatase